MRLLPFEKETVVMAVPPAAIAAALLGKTSTSPLEGGRSKRFTGTVTEGYFTLSLRETKPQNFIPQVSGIIEETSTGSLIFIKYRFFRATRIFLIFWCVLTFFLTLIFLGPGNNYLYGCLSLAGCVANYLIALANFEVHLKHTRKALHKVLEHLT